MSPKLKYIFFAVLLVLGGLYFYNKYNVAPSVDFTKLDLQYMNGERVNWQDFKGKKLIVSLGASWCGNCREELMELNKIKNEKLGDVEVVVISDEPMEKVQRFSELHSYPYIFLKLNQPFPSIGINSIPTTYIVNTQLEVQEEQVGYIEWSDASTVEHLHKLMD